MAGRVSWCPFCAAPESPSPPSPHCPKCADCGCAPFLTGLSAAVDHIPGCSSSPLVVGNLQFSDRSFFCHLFSRNLVGAFKKNQREREKIKQNKTFLDPTLTLPFQRVWARAQCLLFKSLSLWLLRSATFNAMPLLKVVYFSFTF